MPLFLLLRLIFSLLSWIFLAAAVYFLWSWYDGVLLLKPDGEVVRLRDDWRLWTGLVLLAWTFGAGRLLIPVLLGTRDRESPGNGLPVEVHTIAGAAGANLHVETSGSKANPAVVLTHGWALDNSIWGALRRELEKEFYVIAWDLPGLGKSPAPVAAVSLDAFAQDLMAVMSLAGHRKVLLIGHSIGGMTIQTLARNQTDAFAARVSGAVLLNTTYTNPLKTMILPRLMQALQKPLLEPMLKLTIWLEPLAWLSAWQSYLSGSTHMANRIGFGRYAPRTALNQLAWLTTVNRPGIQAQGNLAMFAWDATGAMGPPAVPLLLIAGAADIVTKPEASAVIAADAGDAELLSVDGANHMGFREEPNIYVEATLSFCRAHAHRA